MKKLVTVAVSSAFLLAACTTDPFTGEQKASNTAVGAGLGALVGAGLGALIAKDSRQGALIGAGVGALAGGTIGSYQDRQEAALRAQLQSTGVSVTRVGNDIILNMPDNVTFDVARSEIKSEFYPVLNSVTAVLREYSQTLVDVIGHTDSDGSAESNLKLSQERADSVTLYLLGQQIDPRRLSSFGVGETEPVAPNNTSAGKAQNRRVEIRIVPLTGA
ncbi:MAG: OmpA family protein [Fimbriimonadaceae bacterium]|nr:OmpA family protein [Alphaproteobacteria bacterium]